MIDLLHTLAVTGFQTVRDVAPIVVVIIGFQVLVLKRPVPHLARTLSGVGYVLLGLTCFLVGLEEALFPVGTLMAEQLTHPGLIAETGHAIDSVDWKSYMWVYAFAVTIGFATTIAEPALIAVAIKASSVSGGAITVWGLRVAVALGAATGITLGCYRVITGGSLHHYIMVGYAIVVIQTVFAPRAIIALAYDSGGVTTSTVTVPLVAALGLGLAESVPGRSPLLDGFGMIALAALAPMITVMGYAQVGEWWTRRARRSNSRKDAVD